MNLFLKNRNIFAGFILGYPVLTGFWQHSVLLYTNTQQPIHSAAMAANGCTTLYSLFRNEKNDLTHYQITDPSIPIIKVQSFKQKFFTVFLCRCRQLNQIFYNQKDAFRFRARDAVLPLSKIRQLAILGKSSISIHYSSAMQIALAIISS